MRKLLLLSLLALLADAPFARVEPLGAGEPRRVAGISGAHVTGIEDKNGDIVPGIGFLTMPRMSAALPPDGHKGEAPYETKGELETLGRRNFGLVRLLYGNVGDEEYTGDPYGPNVHESGRGWGITEVRKLGATGAGVEGDPAWLLNDYGEAALLDANKAIEQTLGRGYSVASLYDSGLYVKYADTAQSGGAYTFVGNLRNNRDVSYSTFYTGTEFGAAGEYLINAMNSEPIPLTVYSRKDANAAGDLPGAAYAPLGALNANGQGSILMAVGMGFEQDPAYSEPNLGYYASPVYAEHRSPGRVQDQHGYVLAVMSSSAALAKLRDHILAGALKDDPLDPNVGMLEFGTLAGLDDDFYVIYNQRNANGLNTGSVAAALLGYNYDPVADYMRRLRAQDVLDGTNKADELQAELDQLELINTYYPSDAALGAHLLWLRNGRKNGHLDDFGFFGGQYSVGTPDIGGLTYAYVPTQRASQLAFQGTMRNELNKLGMDAAPLDANEHGFGLIGAWRLWGQTGYHRETRTADEIFGGYKFAENGLILGLDRRFMDGRAFGGFSAGYMAGRLSEERAARRGPSHDIDTMHLGIYGGWTQGLWFANAGGSYALHEYRLKPQANMRNDAKDDSGESFGAFVEAGYRWDRGSYSITPTVGFEYARLTPTPGFTMYQDTDGRLYRGAAPSALYTNSYHNQMVMGIDLAEVDTYQTPVRVALRNDLSERVKLLTRLGYIRNWRADGPKDRAWILGDATSADPDDLRAKHYFDLVPYEMPRNVMEVGMGVDAAFGAWSASLNYDYQWNVRWRGQSSEHSNYHNHNIRLEAGVSW